MLNFNSVLKAQRNRLSLKKKGGGGGERETQRQRDRETERETERGVGGGGVRDGDKERQNEQTCTSYQGWPYLSYFFFFSFIHKGKSIQVLHNSLYSGQKRISSRFRHRHYYHPSDNQDTVKIFDKCRGILKNNKRYQRLLDSCAVEGKAVIKLSSILHS